MFIGGTSAVVSLGLSQLLKQAIALSSTSGAPLGAVFGGVLLPYLLGAAGDRISGLVRIRKQRTFALAYPQRF